MDDDFDYEQVLQYENEIYQVNEDTSESETELTNALARIYYASDKVGDTIIPNKIAGTNDVSENNRSRSSQKGSKHLESDEILHKRKRITYDEDDYPSYSNGQQRGGQRCSLCKGITTMNAPARKYVLPIMTNQLGGNHFGQNCPSLTGSSSSFRNGMWYIMKKICQVRLKTFKLISSRLHIFVKS
ncbi:unnamed protein product [Rhizophagus irregularis]|nr:unnamed protein product [Rhizophagus irregularis]